MITDGIAPAIGTDTAIAAPRVAARRHGTATDTPAPDTVATRARVAQRQRVIRNEGHPCKEGGRETYDNITQHWCSPSLKDTDGEQRGVAINEAHYAPR